MKVLTKNEINNVYGAGIGGRESRYYCNILHNETIHYKLYYGDNRIAWEKANGIFTTSPLTITLCDNSTIKFVAKCFDKQQLESFVDEP